MMQEKRRWVVVDVANADVLAEKLTCHSWCACAGFRHNGYLYLNDCMSADGAQEYGVINEDWMLLERSQVETLTASWMHKEQMKAMIERISEGEFDLEAWPSSITPAQIQSPSRHGVCGHCA